MKRWPMMETVWIAGIPVKIWPFPDFPPEDRAIEGYDPDPHRPAAIDDRGRRWLLDGSGECA